MDATRFDSLTRSLVADGSRRWLLSGIAGVALSLIGYQSTSARRCSPQGDICREHATCCSGVCDAPDRYGRRRCTCPPGQALCNGACIDIESDDNNCGACGVTCDFGRTCVAGACSCGGVPCDCGCVETTDGDSICAVFAPRPCPPIACEDSTDCPDGRTCLASLFGSSDTCNSGNCINLSGVTLC